MAERPRPTTVRYGTLGSQVADLWTPGEDGPQPPVLVLVHGGFWKAIYRRGLMDGLARAATSIGWAAWNIEYRRVGMLGGGGNWETTTADVEAALGHLSQLPRLDTSRVVLCGHSAGGQLALAAAAGSHARTSAEIGVVAAISLAGVLDLESGAALGLGGGAVQAFLGGSPEAVPDRYRQCSPRARIPLGVPQLVVHGSEDTVVPPYMSEEYCAAAMAAGEKAEHVPLAGVDHRDVIKERGPTWDAVARFLERFATP